MLGEGSKSRDGKEMDGQDVSWALGQVKSSNFLGLCGCF